MSDIIQLLPDSVANQIAAGEVIQRPASVLKELVENAVDAEAKTIQVIVVDAGRTCLQVIDDGKGMSETDARLSFERHATSKIRQADDLFALHTMGFRGEALASIAAVAQVELTTRMATDEIGTRLVLSGSKVISQEPVACPVGSNFKVENLFFNVPARRKFLKSNATELNNILTAFERIALVYPDVSFLLMSNGTEMFNLRASNLRQRIVDIFGKRLNQDLLPVEVKTMVSNITGFVGKPESARKKGAHQYFFVNGRYMRHPYFHKAVQSAFERLVPTGEQVPYFLYFDVPAEDIDVNIHPTKTEIKFENEQTIWQILQAAVKEAIGKFNDITAIDFDTEGKPDIPVFDPNRKDAEAPHVNLDPQYNPFTSGATRRTAPPRQWERLYEGLKQQAAPPTESWLNLGVGVEQRFHPTENVGVEQRFHPTGNVGVEQHFQPQENIGVEQRFQPQSGIGLTLHYQYKGRYIMTAVKSGLMVVDQHRAHLRILYEEYIRRKDGHRGNTQKILFPEMVQFAPSDSIIFEKVLPEMELLGFELTALGGGSYAINGIPAGLDGLNPVKLVQDMMASAKEDTNPITSNLNESLALCLARSAAIPYGQVLSNDEMDNLVNQLFACQNVNYTPDGKTILTILPQQDIDSRF